MASVTAAWPAAALAQQQRADACGSGYAVYTDAQNRDWLQDRAGRRVRLALKHGVDGLVVDQQHDRFAIYGARWPVDVDVPQATTISLYAGLAQPHLLWRKTLGGGIYDAAFTPDGRILVVDYRYGRFSVDLRHRRAGPLLDPAQAMPPMAGCGKR